MPIASRVVGPRSYPTSTIVHARRANLIDSMIYWMKQFRSPALFACAALLSTQLGNLQAQAAEKARSVIVARLEGETISPGTVRFLDRAMRTADERNAECLIIVLDTPGGLLQSTRALVKQILGSETPVVVYVAPPGARAASAGVFITMSAHVAAMAPGTTIGAAHPVQAGTLPTGPRPVGDGKDDGGAASTLEEKIVNDTVAWARALAKRRDRNADWAAQAVSKSISVSASEALEQDVVDLMAEDIPELLDALDGRAVLLTTGQVTLSTEGSATEQVAMWWGEQLLTIIAHPNVAFLLLMFGFYGILFEISSPGWGVPGILGVVCMLLGLFGLAVLPVNYLGFSLLLIAMALFVAEIFVTSYGALAVGGTVCLVLGGVMLVDSPSGFTQVSWSVVLPVAAATVAIVFTLMTGVVRAYRAKVRTGSEGLIGETARAVDDFIPRDDQYAGTVRLHGERWKAISPQPVKADQKCRVSRRDGLTLHVEPPGGENQSAEHAEPQGE